jgi:hypothetical protein
MFENQYFKKFEYIVLLCPTYYWNKSYLNWKYHSDPKFICFPISQDNVDKTLKYDVETYKGKSTAIILEDCASPQDIKNTAGEVAETAMRGRHHNHNLFILTQQLTSVAKLVKKNINKLVLFYTPNTKHTKLICDGYLHGVDDKEIEHIIKQLRQHQYTHLIEELRFPYKHYLSL